VYDIFSENCMCQQVPIQILAVLLSIPRNLHGFAQIHRMSHSPEANLARCMLQCTGEVGPFEGWLWFIGPESRALVAHSGCPWSRMNISHVSQVPQLHIPNKQKLAEIVRIIPPLMGEKCSCGRLRNHYTWNRNGRSKLSTPINWNTKHTQMLTMVLEYTHQRRNPKKITLFCRILYTSTMITMLRIWVPY